MSVKWTVPCSDPVSVVWSRKTFEIPAMPLRCRFHSHTKSTLVAATVAARCSSSLHIRAKLSFGWYSWCADFELVVKQKGLIKFKKLKIPKLTSYLAFAGHLKITLCHLVCFSGSLSFIFWVPIGLFEVGRS